MTVTGAGITAANALSPTLKAFAQTSGGAGQESGEWKATTCQGCTSWCSIQAYVVNGRAIKVRGNPNSKVNGEAGCPRQHMSLQQVYDPDRIKVPMKRTNPKKGRDEEKSSNGQKSRRKKSRDEEKSSTGQKSRRKENRDEEKSSAS